MTDQNPRIAVVTVQHGDLPYFPYSTAVNRLYCRGHGYDFTIAAPDQSVEGRHGNWYRVPLVAGLLPRYDFVLYLDADAWFHDHGRRIESLAEQHMASRTLFLVGTDRLNKDVVTDDHSANVGVFLIRNDPAALHLLDEWWHVPDYDPSTLDEWPLEQAAFNRHVRPRWQAGGRVNLIDYRYMNGSDGEFIRHMWGRPLASRVEALRDAYLRLCPAEGSVLKPGAESTAPG